MTRSTLRHPPLTAHEATIARASGMTLARHFRTTAPLRMRVCDEEQAESIELPAGAVALLMEILHAMAEGRGITVLPDDAELTTAQAATLLNVSRPFLVKLIDEKKLPCRRVGKHRRVRIEDVMAYKAAIDRDRENILDELTAEAQQQDMGYATE